MLQSTSYWRECVFTRLLNSTIEWSSLSRFGGTASEGRRQKVAGSVPQAHHVVVASDTGKPRVAGITASDPTGIAATLAANPVDARNSSTNTTVPIEGRSARAILR